MRLLELLDDKEKYVSQMKLKKDIEQVEEILTKKLYAPPDAIKERKPVIGLDLPTGNLARPAHLLQRAWEREIEPMEIANTLMKGKKQHQAEIDAAAKEDNPSTEMEFIDPTTKVKIPVKVKPNPQCRKTQNGNPICLTNRGTFEPKNDLVAKTVMRKGTPDIRSWD